MNTLHDPADSPFASSDDGRVETSYPTTSTQRGILFQSRHGTRAGLYHAQVMLEIAHHLDVDAFRSSWAVAAKRHAALRTSFRDESGAEPAQVVWESVDVPCEYEDWRSSTEEQRASGRRDLLRRDHERGFPADEAPLWRLVVLQLEDELYEVLWSVHYALVDGQSQTTVLRDVEDAYARLVSGQPVDDGPAAPFRTFVDWPGPSDADLCEDFWREQLESVAPASPLPVERKPSVNDRPAAENPLVSYDQASLVLEQPETEALRAAGEQHGVEPATLVRGAWAFLLSRYQGTEDVVMGVTTPGRSADLPGIEDTAGVFINTLPLRTGVPAATGWAEWMRDLERQYAQISRHEYSPLLQIQQWSGIDSGEQLFDSVVTVEEPEERSGPRALRMVRTWEESHAGYPLSVVVTPGQRLTLTVHYDTGRFTAQTVERLVGHLHRILTEFVAKPQARLGELSYLAPAEFSQLVHEWNDTDAPYSHDLCIHQLFERQVEETPDALALLFREERWTYREVDERANQHAHFLQHAGIGRGDQVAILTERSAEMIPALLGVLKAGATYIPLDANAPVKRWHWILDSLEIPCVLTETGLLPHLLAADPLPNLAHVVCLDAEPGDDAPSGEDACTVHGASGIARMPRENLPLQGGSEDIAYIIFTSGSTGTPKGVTVTHFPAVNLIEWVNTTFSVGPDDRMLFVTALTFDLSVYDVFGILAAGGSIRIATGEDIQEPANLLSYISTEPITFWDSAPAALMQLVPFLPTTGDGAHEIVSRSVRLVFMSGDWIPLHSPEVMAAAFPNVQVVGLGGATEATVWSNYFPVGEVDPDWSSIPYGKPIDNARYYVLDESLRPCPIGVPGDLYIGGPCLSLCYANEPQLTASKYLPSPFDSHPGERIYKTGDMARWRADGNLEFLGRTDSQVKIRGYRIELGEIDGVLSEHPVVQDSATIVREDRPGDRTLVSYVVPHPQLARSAVQDHDDALADKRIDRWREVYDAFDPRAAERSEDGHDFSGWNSSYTGHPIPTEEMRAWQDDTVALVRDYAPDTILEIGCGTGLLLFPLASECRRYYGTDFSESVLESIRGRLGSRPDLQETVVLSRRAADELGDLQPEPVDTVIVNSVVQYFPDIDYLLRVLDEAVAQVADGGRIIVGDVRSLPLLDALHADVEAHRAPESMTREQLWQRVQYRVQQEEELTLDPAFFREWAARTGAVSRVEIRPKRDRHLNEMTMFRYQVVLHVSDAARRGAAVPSAELDWSADGLTLEKLRERLDTDRPDRLRLRNVANARVEEAVRTLRWLKGETGLETVEDWRAQDRPPRGVDPEDIRDLAERAGYRADIDWGGHGSEGGYTVALTRAGVEHAPDEAELVTPAAPEDPAPAWSAYANQPLKAEIRDLLLPQLHAHLAERLPGYMVPSDLVALDALPVTSSGKLDRRALLLPQGSASADTATRVPARNTTEALLVSVWEQILGRSPIGVFTSFFELGGHSLLAVQLATRIQQVFSLEVPVRLFFELPTIAEIARELQRRKEEAQPLEQHPITPLPRGGAMPASFDQQRLFFIDRLSPGTTSYTVNWLVPLPASLDAAVLQDGLAEMVRRHEPLRTTFREEDGRVWQVIADDPHVALPTVDLSDLPEQECERQAQDGIRRWWDQPFDIGEGPLLRARLVKLSETEQVLALSAHHTVFDGYSIGLFCQEFLQICRALAEDAPSPLPDPPVQYADYAVWQQNWLEEDRLRFHLDYWKQQLTDAPELLTLPTDFARPPEQSFKGDFLRRQLSAETTDHLARLSREHQVTNYITMLSCFAVFLARHSGQDVVVIGVPIANRNRAELESMIGFLVNTVAVCVDLRDNPGFEDVLLQVRKQLFDAQTHQEVPFERLVEALRPARSLGYNPVFQAMFADESLPFLEHESALVQPKPWMYNLVEQGMSVGVSRFDITCMIQSSPDGMRFGFEYSTDLFTERTVGHMADRFQVLLESALADPGQRVGRLPMVEETERRAIAETGHGAANAQALTPEPLQDLFQERVRRHPDRVAVSFGQSQLTYADLDRRANRLAHLLRDQGVGRESPVGLCMPRSAEMIVGLLAILKAGGAYVPLDPAYPRERLAFMASDAGLRAVLTRNSVLDVLPETDAPVLSVDGLEDDLRNRPDSPPRAGSTPDDLAYVMYTSGSTGRPKGVAVTHGDVAALALDSRFAQGHECVLLHSPQAFDASTYELWVPLLSGGRIVVAPPETVTPSLLREIVPEHGISAVWLTAALFHLFAQEDPGCLAGLGEVWTGGDAVQAEAVSRVRAACPELAVVDGYGPTETTTFAASHRMEPQAEIPAAVPIGRPLDNMRLYVLDGAFQPVPSGVAGELYVGGAGLARGYLNRPDLTAEAFIADPFGEGGGRLYKTGDLARFLPDGTVEILGRVDDQVKIRGFRVELGEIEAVLAQHPDIRDAAVLLHRDGAAKRLVAYTAARSSAAPAELQNDLRDFLGRRLPDYMVPGVFVGVEELPLTPNGKVDRKALADLPWQEHAAGERDRVAPRTPVEEDLARIWQDVLAMGEPVGVHDSFFSLGGDSILSLQVIFRAKQRGLYFTVKQLFQHQTIAELAPVVEHREESAVHAEQGPVTGPAELTPIQNWFFSHDFAHPHHLNQSLLLEVETDLTPRQWQRIVGHLLQHHDALRTRFTRDERRWHAELAAVPEAPPWQVHDLSGYPAAEREDRLVEIAEGIQADLDLSEPPLLRAALFTGLHDGDGAESPEPAPSDGGRNRLLLVAHHLVVDVVSWRIILDDLDTAADQLRRGEEPALPAKTTSWQQWAARLQEEARSNTTAGELPYWQEQSAPARALPLDGSAENNTVEDSRTHHAVLGPDHTRAVLHDLPTTYNTRIDDALLTALAAALGARTGDSHVRVDLEGHGREDLFDDADVSRTVGWFTTISPVRLPVPSADLATGLKRTKELLRHRPRNGIGHGLLAHGPGETGAAAPLGPPAQISFNYLGQFDGTAAGDFATASGKAGPDWHAANQRPYLIDVVSHVQDGRLHMRWSYSASAFHEDTVRTVADHTLEALTRLTERAHAPDTVAYSPSDLPLSGLDQTRIDELVAQLRSHPQWRRDTPRPLDDCYPQTPIQQGLWFQSQFAEGEGIYHVQMVLRIDQELDTDAFHRAWAQTMRRHPILRTGFWDTEGDNALQLVWTDVEVPLHTEDWSAETAEQQRHRLETYLDRDRAQGFAPHDTPQWRMLLARTGPEAYQLVWSAHHAILDGWSISLILNEAVQQYGAHTRGHHIETPPPRPYRDYVAWLQDQDIEQAERYWRETLKGLEQATPLATGTRPGTGGADAAASASVTTHLDEIETARLQNFAQEHRVTLNTVLQGCWAMLLSRYTGTDDVVFGTVVSGRPPDVEGIERTVGLFINTLPLRVQVPEHPTALEWLHSLQEQNTHMRQYDYSPLNQVQQWSDLPPNAPLFETLFVFENYPVEKDESADLRFDMTRSEERVNYPLAVVVVIGDRLEISVQYDPERFEQEAVERMLGHLQSVCAQIVGGPQARLSEITVLTEEERRRILRQGTSAAEEAAVDSDLDLAAFATEIKNPEERELLEQLVAEVQGMSPSDLQVPDYRDE